VVGQHRLSRRASPAVIAQQSEAAAKDVAAWHANALVPRLAACRGYDMAAGFDGDIDAALAPMAMPVLLLPSASDRLSDPAGAALLRGKLAHASYAEIPGDFGHRGIAASPGTPAGDFVARAVRDFLK
jgi:homoserine acetyltransferase